MGQSRIYRPCSHDARLSRHRAQTPPDPIRTYRTYVPVSQSVSQLFHGPAPRSPLHRLAVRLRHSRSNTTSTEYSLPGATQLRPQTTDELPARRQDARPGCGSSLSLTPARCPSRERNSQLATLVSSYLNPSTEDYNIAIKLVSAKA